MSEIRRKRLLYLISFTFAGLVVVFSVFAVYKFFNIGWKCPFFTLTSLRCPGCGTTHALESLLHFEIKKSLGFNYLYPLEMLYLFYVYICCAKNYLSKGKFNYGSSVNLFDILVLAAVVIWTVVRNVSGM